MTFKRLLPLLLITALAGTLCTSCWNRREPELLGVVLAVGFDFDPESKLYRVIAQLANPIAMGGSGTDSEGGGGGGGGKNAFWTVKAEGHTPFEAIRNLTELSSRELFWAHCRILLFSERLARRGVKDIFDLFERGRQFRLIVKPAVVKGDLLKIMEADFPLEETGAQALDRFAVTTRFERSIFPEKDLNELIATLVQPGKEMIVGRVETLDPGNGTSEENGGAKPPVRLGGSALFRGDRMVGWGTIKQTQGWAYGTGRAFRSSFIIESPEKKGRYVSIEVCGHGSRTHLRGNEKNWRIELEVKLCGRIEEFDGPGKLDAESKLISSLEKRAAAAARNRVEAMFSRSQELKADIFGFGNLIHRKNPQLWRKLSPRWEEEIYPQLDIELTVNFKILRAGLIKNPL